MGSVSFIINSIFMSDLSQFKSRTGLLKSSAEECFEFVTDIRNFERFIPKDTISNWQSGRESCSFSVSMLGRVSVRIAHKEEFSRVVFNGDALKKNDFELVLHIAGNINKRTEVMVELNADLNPMMKMVAKKPIGQFLEMLINEMENFDGWKDIKD
jgi:ribosome-associated toxin RatA of RatAB toxin-antitoxin module